MKKILLLNLVKSVTFAMAVLMAGCGGGGGDNGVNSPAQQKTAIVAFVAMSSSVRLPVRINGIAITVILPAGVSVTKEPSSANQVSITALSTGDAVTRAIGASNRVYGRYSAAGKRVDIQIADTSTTQAGFGPGEFARLTCIVTPGTILTEEDFSAGNRPVPYFKAVGYDTATRSSVDLTGYLNPLLKVTFGN